jgi:hypothetical protein
METSHEQVASSSVAEEHDAPAEQLRELLEEHVPLSLIMDLSAPDGPGSKEILDAEGVPEQAWWKDS